VGRRSVTGAADDHAHVTVGRRGGRNNKSVITKIWSMGYLWQSLVANLWWRSHGIIAVAVYKYTNRQCTGTAHSMFVLVGLLSDAFDEVGLRNKSKTVTNVIFV
jgi:hypothetical protein